MEKKTLLAYAPDARDPVKIVLTTKDGTQLEEETFLPPLTEEMCFAEMVMGVYIKVSGSELLYVAKMSDIDNHFSIVSWDQGTQTLHVQQNQ